MENIPTSFLTIVENKKPKKFIQAAILLEVCIAGIEDMENVKD